MSDIGPTRLPRQFRLEVTVEKHRRDWIGSVHALRGRARLPLYGVLDDTEDGVRADVTDWIATADVNLDILVGSLYRAWFRRTGGL